jgi:outer membrane receptor protein involved in Fe transport
MQFRYTFAKKNNHLHNGSRTMSKNSFAVRSLIALAVASAFPLHSALATEAEASAQPAAAEGQDAASTAQAPATTKGQLETVIVTAQRRAENIKDVPMAIATLKGDKLDVLTSGGQTSVSCPAVRRRSALSPTTAAPSRAFIFAARAIPTST